MPSSEQLVSVIIPAYNHERFVQQTIRSIIGQSYKNIELIIIDDGSTDSTWLKINELKKECEERFSRVVFKTKKNEGTCLTLNALLAEAKGEYIYLIASDDLAKSNAVSIQLDFLSNNFEYSLVVGDNEIIDENGVVCYWDKDRNIVYSKKEAKYLTFCDALQKQKGFKFTASKFGKYETIYPCNYIPNGILIRKSIFNLIGKFTPEAPLEDYWLMLQVSKYSKLKYIDTVLFSYRWHSSNTISKVNKMHQYTAKTRKYETVILSNISSDKLLINIDKIKKKGVLYKREGIPFIFEVLSFAKLDEKIKVVKLFNITIFKKSKKI